MFSIIPNQAFVVSAPVSNLEIIIYLYCYVRQIVSWVFWRPANCCNTIKMAFYYDALNCKIEIDWFVKNKLDKKNIGNPYTRCKLVCFVAFCLFFYL
jgi:hypothetical protein